MGSRYAERSIWGARRKHRRSEETRSSGGLTEVRKESDRVSGWDDDDLESIVDCEIVERRRVLFCLVLSIWFFLFIVLAAEERRIVVYIRRGPPPRWRTPSRNTSIFTRVPYHPREYHLLSL
jgi:hypothetical protein